VCLVPHPVTVQQQLRWGFRQRVMCGDAAVIAAAGLRRQQVCNCTGSQQPAAGRCIELVSAGQELLPLPFQMKANRWCRACCCLPGVPLYLLDVIGCVSARRCLAHSLCGIVKLGTLPYSCACSVSLWVCMPLSMIVCQRGDGWSAAATCGLRGLACALRGWVYFL
jgi:hypothetical protein